MQQRAEEQGLLGKLCPGEKKLEGKTFYLDGVKKRSTALLLEAISLLGGRVESFLHKDVSFVVTESQESLKEQDCSDVKGEVKGTNEGTQRPTKQRESVLSNERHRPVTPRPAACGSRGKALLEKAIRNNERLKGSSVLTNARSWGVKILYVNNVLLYLKQLTRESLSVKHKKSEKTYNKQSSHVVKATALRSPYLKIEDSSRKFKPLHMQSMTFPSLWYSGRFSPFESAPPRFEKRTEQEGNITREKNEIKSSVQNKCETPISCNPSLWRPRKKDASYCECCHQHFTNLEEHLQSDQHRTFVLDPSNYSMVDQLVVDMLPEFNHNASQQSEEILNRPPTPLSIQDFCELQPLSDVETELAVQALQKQGSSFTAHISCPNRGHLSSGRDSPSPAISLPIPNPVTPPADIQSLPNAECHFSDIQAHCSSPAMPVLDVEPQAHNSACHLPDNHHLSPFPETPCTSCDPYPLAPVLSPQVPYSSYIVEPHSSYSDPPILSPQKYTEEELVEGVLSQMHMAESLTESFSPEKVSTPPLPLIPVVNAEREKASNQEDPLVFNGIICSSNCLECDKCDSSRFFSRPSATAVNPKKRHPASPENSRSKRRRLTGEFGYSCRWTEQGHISAKQDSDIMPKPKNCFSFDKASCQITPCPNPNVSTTFSTSTVETLVSKQTFDTFCVPAVQNFILAPRHINNLCHGGTSVADQPSWPQSSTAKGFDYPLQFPSNKCHNGFSSLDSQRSLSHSTSVCIESALIPDLATLSPSSSDSDWDYNLLSHMGPASTTSLPPTEQSCDLDKELLHRPCTWMHNTSYESRLHTVLEPSTPGASLCGEDMDPSAFSRTVVQIVEVQH